MLTSRISPLVQMTTELNMRRVTDQANQLEKEIQALAAKTEHDEAFRAQNERRMSEVSKEIAATRLQMDNTEATGLELMALQHKTAEEMKIMQELHKQELLAMQESVSTILQKLTKLPSNNPSKGPTTPANTRQTRAEAEGSEIREARVTSKIFSRQ